MSTAWARRYGSPLVSNAARLEIARRTRECDVQGCTNLVMDDSRCLQCRDELRALEEYEQLRKERKAAAADRRQRRIEGALTAWLYFWDWLRKSELVNWVLLFFVAWAVGYVAAIYSDAWIQWLADLAGVK